MALFGKNDGGIMDVIRCDEQEYLIWKWHPQNTSAQESKRANAIRMGSSLRVKEGSVAVFVYPQADGSGQDFIEGPFDGIIETKNFPVLASLVGLLYQGNSPFQAEIYFINLAGIIQIKFGVPYFDVFDPRFMDYGVPTAVRGAISFHIEDYKAFIKLHRMDSFSMDDMRDQVKDMVIRHVKSVVSNIPMKESISVVHLERHISEISALVEKEVSDSLARDFAVAVSRLDISDIEVDKNSSGYKKLEALTQNKATTIAQGAVNIADALSVQRLGAKKMKSVKKEDMGIGENERESVAKRVASSISGMLDGVKKAKRGTPPPVPKEGYHIVINGKKKGPFSSEKLAEKKQTGELDKDTLVWKAGMEDWVRAEEVDELQPLFSLET